MNAKTKENKFYLNYFLKTERSHNYDELSDVERYKRKI